MRAKWHINLSRWGQWITHFFVLLVLDRVLLEGLISDALQVIHKGLLIGQHLVHVTVLAPLNL